jgi:hypothetical protein
MSAPQSAAEPRPRVNGAAPRPDQFHKRSTPQVQPRVMGVAEVLALNVPTTTMLIESMVTIPGASLIVGASKAGKSILAVQMAIAIASGHALFDNYRVLEPGPAMLVEEDDPGGAASVQDLLKVSPVSVEGIPFWLVDKVRHTFGLEFTHWLEGEITRLRLRFVALDSYTALRASRSAGMDIVKQEHYDLNLLNELAKRTNCAIVILHHVSKASYGMDWNESGAGTYAVQAAVEGLLHVSRFADLDSTAPERLVRMRGRHCDGSEMVIKFRKETLDYEHVLEGPAAPLYPVVTEIRATFGNDPFGTKEFYQATGIGRTTAHGQLSRLIFAGTLKKRGQGEYQLA